MLEGNKIYSSDTRLLSSLGISYFRTGGKQRALETPGFSLRLNPEQEKINKLVREIEKR